MGGRKRDYYSLSRIQKQCINDCVTEEVGRRFMSVLGEIGDGSTTAAEDTAKALKYYATARCMLMRMQDEMKELTSYMAALDSLPEDRKALKKATKLYEAKQERYENLEAEAYKIERWLSDIDFAISRLENPEHVKWIVGKYKLEKTDNEITEGVPGICMWGDTASASNYHLEKAINTLKYYMFPMKALREDVLNIKGRNKFSKK